MTCYQSLCSLHFILIYILLSSLSRHVWSNEYVSYIERFKHDDACFTQGSVMLLYLDFTVSMFDICQPYKVCNS